jgi:hypothetical protein
VIENSKRTSMNSERPLGREERRKKQKNKG